MLSTLKHIEHARTTNVLSSEKNNLPSTSPLDNVTHSTVLERVTACSHYPNAGELSRLCVPTANRFEQVTLVFYDAFPKTTDIRRQQNQPKPDIRFTTIGPASRGMSSPSQTSSDLSDHLVSLFPPKQAQVVIPRIYVHACLRFFPSSIAQTQKNKTLLGRPCERGLLLSLPFLLGDRQEQLELRGQLLLGVEAVGEVNAADPTVRVDLYPQRLDIVRAVRSSREVAQVELDLVPALLSARP